MEDLALLTSSKKFYQWRKFAINCSVTGSDETDGRGIPYTIGGSRSNDWIVKGILNIIFNRNFQASDMFGEPILYL